MISHIKCYMVLFKADDITIDTLAEWLTRQPAKLFPSGACVRITQVSITFCIFCSWRAYKFLAGSTAIIMRCMGYAQFTSSPSNER